MTGDELPPNRCDECGQRFYYAPSVHKCATDADRALHAALLRGEGESWADECVRRVMAPSAEGQARKRYGQHGGRFEP